jgi:hypothetical protein
MKANEVLVLYVDKACGFGDGLLHQGEGGAFSLWREIVGLHVNGTVRTADLNGADACHGLRGHFAAEVRGCGVTHRVVGTHVVIPALGEGVEEVVGGGAADATMDIVHRPALFGVGDAIVVDICAAAEAGELAAVFAAAQKRLLFPTLQLALCYVQNSWNISARITWILLLHHHNRMLSATQPGCGLSRQAPSIFQLP